MATNVQQNVAALYDANTPAKSSVNQKGHDRLRMHLIDYV